MKRLLFFLLAIIFAIQVFAQNVQIGSGTSSQYYIPVRANYGYTYSQQIIKSSEISASGQVTTGGTISKIRFYWNGSGDFNNSTQWKVYLGHSTKTLFSSATDWVPVSGLSLVFDTLITPPTLGGWFTITLQTPFVYNGIDNLILGVDENTPAFSYNEASFTSYSSTDCGLYYYDDFNNPDPASPPIGTKTSNLPQVKLYFQEACATPENLQLLSLNSNDATFNWVNGALETLWNIQYKLTSDATWTSINSVTKPYQITGLTPNSTYELKVQSNCGLAVSNWSDSLVFTTPAIATQLPFTTNFESTTDNVNWQFINGTQVNKWFVGNAKDPITGLAVDTLGTSGSLYISRNANGDTNIYSGGSSANVSLVYAFRDFFIPSGATEVNLEFDWRANGNSPYSDFLRVYLVPTSSSITAGVIPQGGLDVTAQIGNYSGGIGVHRLNKKTFWQHAKFRITSTQFPNLANNTWRLLVHWRNESTYGTTPQPPAAVDNLKMNVITCPAPTTLVASNKTTNAVGLSWIETGTATVWNIYYKDASSSTWSMAQATSNPFTLANLNPSTPYQVKVQSNCGTDTSYTTPITNFNTACAPITVFPWNEGFESGFFQSGYMGNAPSPLCWTNVDKGTGGSNWIENQYNSHSGAKSAVARISYSQSQNNDWLITPSVPLTGNERLRFWAMQDDYIGVNDTISIWINSSSTFDTTGMGTFNSIPGFVKLAEIGVPDNATWAQYEVNLQQYIGNAYIAFVRRNSAYNEYGIIIDDVEVSEVPSCIRPDSLSVSNILADSASISWVDTNSLNTSWNLYYKKSSDTVFTKVQGVVLSPYTLTPIASGTTYQVYVTTDCVYIESEATPIVTFTTPCVSIDALTALPWSEGFESIAADDQLPNICWSATNLGWTTFTQTSNYGSDNRNAHTGTKSAYFKWGCNDYFYTPGFDLQAGTTYTFSYWYVTDGIGGWTILKAGAYSAQSNTSFIQNVGNPIANPINTTYQQYIGTFTPTTNGVYYFGVNCQATYSPNYLTIDDFRLEIINCGMPTNLTAKNATPTSFDITWNAGTSTSWQVEYKMDTATTWTKQMVATDSLHISGLTPSTKYQVRVAALCNGVADTSYFTIISFFTPCLSITTIPYTETFDNYGTGSYANWNNCWYRTSTYSSSSYPYIEGTNFSSPGSMYFYVASGDSNYNLVCSPSIDPTIPINTLRVKFKIRKSSSYPGLIVGVMSNPNDTSTFVQIGSIIGTTVSNTWEDKEVSFASYTGVGTYIAFKCQGTAVSGNSFYIDNVEVSVIPTCANPTNLSISNITPTTAVLSWINGNANNSSWWLYTKLTSATNYDSILITSVSPYTIINLLPSSQYNYYMRTNCTTEFSEPTPVNSFRTACGVMTIPTPIESFVTVLPNDCWSRYFAPLPATGNASLTSITTGWVANSQVTPHNSKIDLNSFLRYNWLVTPSVDLNLTTSNQVEFDVFLTAYYTANAPNVSAYYTDKKFYVLISTDDGLTWNASNVLRKWDNAGSLDTLNALTNLPLHVTIPIVDTANNPYTGIVKFAFYAESTVSGFDNDLHIDNFQVTGQICSSPITLITNLVTQTTADITWSAGGAETNWQIKLGNAGTLIDVQVTNYSFMNLTPNTQYTVYVRSSCGANIYSSWVPLTFTTQSMPSNPTVTTSSITTITYNTAILGGSYIQGTDAVNAVGFELKEATATSWTNQAVSPVATPFSYNATGLTPSTLYKVRAFATTNAGTFYGDTASFTTSAFNVPIVTTDSIFVYYGNTTAKLYGSIAQGTENIMARGFEYKTFAQTWAEALELSATGTTSITATATGLVSGANYDVRAYAETQSGKTYGAEKNFNATSGLNEIEAKQIEVSLYPNPANTKTTVCVRGIFERIEMEFVDMLGRTLKRFNLKSSNGEAKQVIEVGDLEKGIYYVRIKNNNKTISTQKLIIR